MSYGNITITADYSDIKDLDALLKRASERPHKVRAQELDRVGAQVESEGRANAAAFHKDSTGELAAAVTRTGTPVFQRIYANVRQAFFQEYGSPNTGAPNPWLSGPAQKGADELFDELSKAAEPW